MARTSTVSRQRDERLRDRGRDAGRSAARRHGLRRGQRCASKRAGGVGAQTVTLRQQPAGRISRRSDVSADSIAEAAPEGRPRRARRTSTFRQADILRCRSRPHRSTTSSCASCWSTSREPARHWVLGGLLRPGGIITVIEGHHGSGTSTRQRRGARAIDCLVTLQRADGGDALIGRRAVPADGRRRLRRGPRVAAMVYVDAQPPGPRRRVHAQDVHRDDRGRRASRAIAAGLIDAGAFDAGIRGPAPDGRARRRLLLHVLQGRRPQARDAGTASRSRPASTAAATL